MAKASDTVLSEVVGDVASREVAENAGRAAAGLEIPPGQVYVSEAQLAGPVAVGVNGVFVPVFPGSGASVWKCNY